MTPATLNELTRIGKLSEITRSFEVELVKMATNPPHEAFIDEIRVRNANLDILCSKVVANPDNL